MSDFLPVLKLYDLLYPESEPLPVPSADTPSCTYKMAVICIWIHIQKKAMVDTPASQNPAIQKERFALQRNIPRALSNHVE